MDRSIRQPWTRIASCLAAQNLHISRSPSHLNIQHTQLTSPSTQRKFVTTVTGLEAFSLENKKVAKDLGKKFATGSSVTKVPSGGEEIVVQGDVSEEIEEFLLEKYPVIPEDNIELVEDKKKKAGAGAPAG